MTTEAICDECHLPLTDERHLRGTGLHGHESTSAEEADRQRIEILSSMIEFDPQAGFSEEQFNAAKDAVMRQGNHRFLKDLDKEPGTTAAKTKAVAEHVKRWTNADYYVSAPVTQEDTNDQSP